MQKGCVRLEGVEVRTRIFGTKIGGKARTLFRGVNERLNVRKDLVDVLAGEGVVAEFALPFFGVASDTLKTKTKANTETATDVAFGTWPGRLKSSDQE